MFLGHAACAILIHENRQFMVYTTTNRMSPSSRDPGKAAFEANALRSHGQTARHAMEGVAWGANEKGKLQRKRIYDI